MAQKATLECLRDYVGIYGCNTPEPESGLFINELGIALESIEKLSTPEQQNFLGVWADVQTRAIRRLEAAINSYFSTRYKLNRIQEMVAVGYTTVNLGIVTPPSPQWRGFVYKATDTNGEPRSVLQRLDLQNITIYTPTIGVTITIAVFELSTGRQLWSTTATSNGESLNVNVNLQDYFDGVFVGYYADTLPSNESKIDASSDCDCECSTACCNGELMGATVEGATVNNFNLATLATGNNTFGVCAVLSMRCDWANLVCATKSYFANAYWYALGEEMMSERIYSSRLNKFALLAKEEARERRDEFKQRYHEELQMAVECITLDTNDCCVECNEPVIKTEVNP